MIKRSKITYIAGLILFLIGSVLVQQVIEPMLYFGIVSMVMAYMLIGSHLHYLEVEEIQKSKKDLKDYIDNVKKEM